MAYNGQENKRESVYTRSYQFYNADDKTYPGTMVCSHWDNFVKVTINPAKPVEQRTQTSVYDYDTAITTAISLERTQVLLKGIKKYIIPIINDDTQSASVGVQVGANNQLAVYCNKGKLVLMIFKDIDEQTMKPASSYGYVFNKNMIIKNYDAGNGSFDVEYMTSEFDLFVTILEESVKAGTGAMAHQNDLKNRFKKQSNNTPYTNKGSLFDKANNQLGNSSTKDTVLVYTDDISKLLG